MNLFDIKGPAGYPVFGYHDLFILAFILILCCLTFWLGRRAGGLKRP